MSRYPMTDPITIPPFPQKTGYLFGYQTNNPIFINLLGRFSDGKFQRLSEKHLKDKFAQLPSSSALPVFRLSSVS